MYLRLFWLFTPILESLLLQFQTQFALPNLVAIIYLFIGLQVPFQLIIR